MNPKWQDRLSVEDAVQDPWLSNRHRWITERYETLDAHDVGKVLRVPLWSILVATFPDEAFKPEHIISCNVF